MKQKRILLIDDTPEQLAILKTALEERFPEVVFETRCKVDASLLQAEAVLRFDLIVTDQRLGALNGSDLARYVAKNRLPTPVILFSGQVGSEIEGATSAFGYVYREDENWQEKLASLVRDAFEFSRQETKPERFGMVGKSPKMLAVFERIAQVGPTDKSVLITGETGTGKELVARAIHQVSNRRGKLMVVQCGAIPEGLAESELFGHVRGAFTGAIKDHTGKFVAASNGTLSLDEVGELLPNIQTKLLRALQEHQVTPVGSNEHVSFDARIVATTHRDLQSLVGDGQFREDLYYRLHVASIDVPPLRERRDDIPLLVRKFAGDRQIAHQAWTRLLAHDWPGNVRQLEHAIEHAVLLAGDNIIELSHLPPEPTTTIAGGTLGDLKERAGLERIQLALTAAEGNITKAAEILGIDRRTLHTHLSKWPELRDHADKLRNRKPK